jgi:hypothetical protein
VRERERESERESERERDVLLVLWEILAMATNDRQPIEEREG